MKHKHHVVPRHMGGTDSPENLAEVTIEEHANLHLAMYLEHGRWQDWYAAWGLAGSIDIDGLILEMCRQGGYKSKGRKLTEEHKKNLSIAAQRPRSDAWKQSAAMSFSGEGNGFYGKEHSAETKAKMSEARRGRRWWTNGKETKLCFDHPGEGWVPGRK